jgi:hypothetical protein
MLEYVFVLNSALCLLLRAVEKKLQRDPRKGQAAMEAPVHP